MSTENAPVTIDALMALVNRYAEACDDLGTDLFAQDATKHAALRAAAAGAYAQIRAGIEQYGLEMRAAVTGPMDSHGRYWVENRGKIIDALSEAGLRLMSDKDRFWIAPKLPAA